MVSGVARKLPRKRCRNIMAYILTGIRKCRRERDRLLRQAVIQHILVAGENIEVEAI
jgi:hypothetical protein